MKHLILAVLFMSYAPRLFAQCNGGVAGWVEDQSGNPVRDATVSLVERNPRPGPQALRNSQTNAEGSFHITVEAAGRYVLFAKKENDGYPETRAAFYSNLELTEVELDCSTVRTGVVIRLGPKAAHLGHILVTDSITGKPIQNASITLRRAAAENLWITSSTTYENIAVPPNVDITYEVSAPGYLTSPRVHILMAPSEKKDIQVQLMPAPAATS